METLPGIVLIKHFSGNFIHEMNLCICMNQFMFVYVAAFISVENTHTDTFVYAIPTTLLLLRLQLRGEVFERVV